jgi:hypothetical protein
MERPVAAPAASLLVLEQLAIAEFGAFLASSPILRLLGRGDEHPVLVLPGFTGDDHSTRPLRWFLRAQGYWVHGWGLGRNLGPTPEIVDGVKARLRALHQDHGRTVSLVGWSLGGIFARELARELPSAVRQVITLGSPFRLRPGDRSNADHVATALRHRHVPLAEDALAPEHERPRLNVPVTAIYTRTDGIVSWLGCIESSGERCENIEVRGTHSGLGHNPAVLIAVADRLAQPEGEWRPFRPPHGTAHLYPRPTTYRSNAAEADSHAAAIGLAS